MKVNVTRTSLPDYKEYCDEIKDLWDSHWITNMGIKHKEFQKKLEDYFECKHVALYTNGHLALENIIEAFDFKKGSEIITTPFTFVSTTHAIVRNGLIPVFCDINDKDYTIDATKIESLITDKTVAILPVHVYGNVCDVEEIDRIAKKHNLKVIYDAAHAFGVKYKGKPVVNYGDASILSFHATKVFHTVEGGAVVFNDENLVQKLNDLKNFGIHGPESVEYVGGNAKMSEFQAAMGICNLRHIDEWIKQRKELVECYYNKLSNINGIKLLEPQKDVETNYSYLPVIFDGYKYTRDEIYNKLAKEDIMARKYFYPLINELNCYKDKYNINDTQIAKNIASNVLTLPLYLDLDKKTIEIICDVIIK